MSDNADYVNYTLCPGQVVPVALAATPEDMHKPSPQLSHYISWSELLCRTFEIDTVCPACKSPLRLIAMIETEDAIKRILSATGLPSSASLRPHRQIQREADE